MITNDNVAFVSLEGMVSAPDSVKIKIGGTDEGMRAKFTIQLLIFD